MAIGPAGIFHLVVFGIVLIGAAFASRQRLASHQLPPRPAHFVTVLVQQLVFAGLSLTVAWFEGIPVLSGRFPAPLPAGTAVVGLVVTIAVMRPLWRRAVERRDRLVALAMPRNPLETRLWCAIALVSGIGEEITYRGVLFVLLTRVSGSPEVATVASAVVFGLSHAVQGAGGILLSGLYGLGFQVLAIWSGGLFLPMMAHMAYDLAAGLTLGRMGEELGYPLGDPAMGHRDAPGAPGRGPDPAQ